MKYFEILKCKKDPFPGTPFTEGYFPAGSHDKCLSDLLTSVDEKNCPMTVVLGAVGSGKTTISLQLLGKLSVRQEIHAVLTDYSWFVSREKCIIHLAEFLAVRTDDGPSIKILEERLKAAIVDSEQESEVCNVLLIDQGEKIPYYCLELFESIFAERVNSAKLQIIVFARPIFESKLHQYLSLVQNSNLSTLSQKWTFAEITAVLDGSFKHAESRRHPSSLFTKAGRYYSYVVSRGCPGKALELCKITLLNQIIHNCPKAGLVLCHQTAKEISLDLAKRVEVATVMTVGTVFVAMLLSFFVVKNGSAPLPGQQPLHNPVFIDKGIRPTVKVSPTVVKEKEIARVVTLPVVVADDEQIASKSYSAEVLPAHELKKKAVVPSGVVLAKQIPLVREIPEILGQISVFERETLGDMITRVYGPHSFTPRSLGRVLEQNPQLKNNRFLNVGDVVKFPNMAIGLAMAAEQRWWIHVITIDTLQDAYRYLRIYDSESRELRMIPSLGEAVFTYTILLANNFSSEQEAVDELAQLPRQIFPGAKLLDGLSHDSFFYQMRPEKIVPQTVKKRVMTTPDPEKSDVVVHKIPEQGHIPENLGNLIMAKGDSLGNMIRGVYGKNSVYPKNIKWLVSHNRHIKNPNTIVPKTVLTFPVRAVKISEADEANWWIQLGTYANLQDAYSALRNRTHGKAWLLIIPTFLDGQSIFTLIIEKSYGDEATARERIGELSQQGGDARLIPGLDHQKFYYKSKIVRPSGKRK